MCKLNDVKNVKCLCGKCEKLIGEIGPCEDMVVFVDPARLGMHRDVLDVIIKLNPRVFVYMSCNPETCIRDINVLTNDNKYIVTDIKPYNMFPFTEHIEILVKCNRGID